MLSTPTTPGGEIVFDNFLKGNIFYFTPRTANRRGNACLPLVGPDLVVKDLPEMKTN